MTFFGFATGVLALLIVAGGIYNIFAVFCVGKFFGRRRRGPMDRMSFPPVSILKPVKGLDTGFWMNIGSFCRQDYPEYEVLIGFVGDDDEALAEARAIAEAHPTRVRVVTGGERSGANEKVSNLKGLIAAARYPIVAFSDSDMKVDELYLKTIVEEYLSEENVGLVTSLYKSSEPATIGAALESLTIASDFIPSVLVAQRLEGITFGLGASMLVSKKAIEEIGGLAAIGNYLADDYQIGNKLWKKGYKIILSHYVMEDVAGRMGISDYLVHQLRWARTYRASRPKGFLGYGITHILPLSFILLILRGASGYSLLMFCAALGLRIGLASMIYRKAIRVRGWLKWLFLLPVKDVFAFGIWAWSFLGRRVYWRGTYYAIEKEGIIKTLTEGRPSRRKKGSY